MTSRPELSEMLRELHKYSACDVSDALLKLQVVASGEVARAGYLSDIVPFALGSTPPQQAESHDKIIGPARTLKLIPKSDHAADTTNAVPKGSHWVDMTEVDTVMIIEQPDGQSCAAIGGIMATKMKVNGVLACVVGGRVRDIEELKASGLPVFATGKSTVATGAEAKVFARNVPITIRGVNIAADDIIFCDPAEGTVVIPRDLLKDTLDLMPKLVSADDKVKEAVMDGMSVVEAFKKFRG